VTNRTRTPLARSAAVLIMILLALGAALGGGPAAAQTDATPAAGDPCAAATPAAEGVDQAAMGSPAAGMGMDMGSPAAGMSGMEGMAAEFDQLYIDMMIPHHQSIIAMAEAALTRLEDERLRGIARAVIDAQGPELEELREYRERFYGGAEPVLMDGPMMGMMERMMPGMASMDEMAFQMDAAAQVAAICAAADADKAFIDLTIPHHEMAIASSEAALEQATNGEIRDFGRRVIDAQEAEIAELAKIREELYGSATPEPVSS
jgi:uncharacterized protein (DUF305 family)